MTRPKPVIAKDGLKPVIVQDALTKEVLMLAWANEEALKKTKKTGYAWFFSRSRQKLWKKGETSGNEMKISEIRDDCDKDALLYIVQPKGPACHRGTYSCFRKDKPFTLESLEEIISQRKRDLPEGSYTAKLLQNPQLLKRKIIEEATELILTESRDETTYEAVDVLYHLLALLASKGINLLDVYEELRKRSQS